MSHLGVEFNVLQRFCFRDTTLGHRGIHHQLCTFLLYPMRSMGESIGIGLGASSTSKGPQAKTTEPMDSIKVTYCNIQLG